MSNAASDLKPFIATLADGASLSREAARDAFEVIMSGDATAAQTGAFLMGLRVRGETVDEITGAVTVMRDKMNRVSAPEGAIDIVGTGGDGIGTLNISTATALVVAGCGVPVAKHGNKALSSKSGAADVLTSLGVNMGAGIPTVEKAIREAGIGFMMAPLYHSAMRHVGPARVEMGTRTIFNLLGPLSNPAGVSRQLTGVFSRAWVEPIAQALGNLGCERALVVHGSDGTDELTTTGVSYIAEWKDGQLTSSEMDPGDYGLATCRIEDLKGGDGAYNAQAIRDLLEGKPGAYRDVVLYNAAASLMVAGKTEDMASGLALAARAIDDGKALQTLVKLIEITQADKDGSN